MVSRCSSSCARVACNVGLAVRPDATGTGERHHRRVANTPTMKRALILAGVAVAAVAAAAVLFRSSPRTSAQLLADARSLPTPAGVVLERQASVTNDAGGFSTQHFQEAELTYANIDSCDTLRRSWERVLSRARRHFKRDDHPHSFGAIGSLGIAVTDRPEHLGITLGTDDGRCARPFIYALNNPH